MSGTISESATASQLVYQALANVLAARAGNDVAAAEIPPDDAWQDYDISQDLSLKFAVCALAFSCSTLPTDDAQLAKQTMQLTGRRLPDPALASFATAGDIAAYLATPVKPPSLAETLLANPALAKLPNVEIYAHRYGSRSRDIEFGRAKVIRGELAARGLLPEQEESPDWADEYQEEETVRREEEGKGGNGEGGKGEEAGKSRGVDYRGGIEIPIVF